jgi:hypothetical protein
MGRLKEQGCVALIFSRKARLFAITQGLPSMAQWMLYISASVISRIR